MDGHTGCIYRSQNLGCFVEQVLTFQVNILFVKFCNIGMKLFLLANIDLKLGIDNTFIHLLLNRLNTTKIGGRFLELRQEAKIDF